MQTQEITIVNKLGLHARASAKLTKLAGSFQCDETDGPQETEALQALVALIEDKFGEGE